MTEAFNIDRVAHVKGNQWRVEGRAYEDVRIGETLTIGPSDTRGFKVVDIVAYGVHVPELSRMVAGVLLVRGEEGGLRQATFLYK
jgi:hypothetical protein